MKNTFFLLLASTFVVAFTLTIGTPSVADNNISATNLTTSNAPQAVSISCPSIATVYLDDVGEADYEAEDFATASSPGCDSIIYTISPTSANIGCNDLLTPVFDVTINAIDTCGDFQQCVVSITITDTISPTLVCPPDMTVATNGQTCDMYVTVPKPDFQDNCSFSTITNNHTGVPSASGVYNKGLTTVTFTATDNGNNTATCSINVTVTDGTSAELTCEDSLTVALTSTGSNFLNKSEFIREINDNCQGYNVQYGVSRNGNCNPNDTATYGENVHFCCNEINSFINVTVTATDLNNNTNACMVVVMVQDNLPPVLTDTLPDITVSCSYFIDANDLTEFGVIKIDTAFRDTIKLNDPLYANDKYNGVFTDNCIVKYTVKDTIVKDSLFNGGRIIYRNYSVHDNSLTISNKGFTDTQIITVMDITPLTINDIEWPRDTTITGNCDIMADSTLTGFPIINDTDVCTMPAFRKDDLVFDYHTTGCIFIKRTWTVIDMAQFVPNTNQGRWTHVQYIIVDNDIAPTIDSGCDAVVLCAPQGQCEGNATLTITASDDCTTSDKLYYRYLVDLGNDGTIDFEGENDSLNVFFPAGDHLVTWKVEDRCGNLVKCEVPVTMKECKAPIPVCLNGLSINLNEQGQAAIWASDFNNHSYDNCTSSSDLEFSFSTDTSIKSTNFDCTTLGRQNLNMYVTDKTGNQSFCTTFITVTDNLLACPSTTQSNFKIAGAVATEEKVEIAQAKIILDNGVESSVLQTTEKGKFSFTELLANADYTLLADKNDRCLEGVSTLDLVLMQRHILGQSILTSPYKLIAADVNASGSITAGDLVDLRKLILGIHNELPNRDCWEFIDKGFSFVDPTHPWTYPTNIKVENLDIDLTSSDFVAVKIGDLNGSVSNIYEPSSETRSTKMAQLTANDIVFEAGEQITIPINIMEGIDMVAMQMNFSYDANALTFLNLESDVLDIPNSYFTHKMDDKVGNITLAYSNAQNNVISSSAEIMYLTFTTNISSKLSNVFTENSSSLQSVIYDNDLEMSYIQFDFDVEELIPFEVGNPSPNPFVNQTQVTLKVAYDMPLEVAIYDQSGKKVYTNYSQYSPGIHTLNINSTILPSQNGVFFLHISGAEMKEIKKLIRIE